MMIEVEHLTKYYGSTAAIQDLTFQVQKGEVLGFLGPNGAGKTTIMRILSGYMPATSGRATVAGYDVASQPLEVRRRVGYLPAHNPLYREMTVRNYLHFVATVKGVPHQQRTKQVSNAMATCSVHAIEQRMIASLARGQRQRVGLAQALLNTPPVLLLDEPTVGLDPGHMFDIRQIVNNLRHHHTVMLSTHILPEVRVTCDRVVVVSDGQIIAVDTPDNLTAQTQRHRLFVLEVLGPSDHVHTHLQRIDGVVCVEKEDSDSALSSCYTLVTMKDRDLRAHIAHTVIQQGWQLLELRPQRLTLEQVFAQLVTEEERVDA